MLPTIKRQTNWLPTLFNDFFREDWLPIHPAATPAPAINVKETDEAFAIEMAVPGMKKEDFRVHLSDKDQLVVSVEKKSEEKEEDKKTKFLRREFSYSRFEQTLFLPENIDREKITAKVCSGVLHITLPKVKDFQVKEPTRTIEIQ